MLKFLIVLFRIAAKVSWCILVGFLFILENSEFEPRISSDEGEDDFEPSQGFGIGRTSAGSVEPSTTSSRGESVGLFSSTRMN